MTRQQRRQRRHERRQQQRDQAGAWGTNMRCAHCGHGAQTHITGQCANCNCADFDH